MFLKPGFEYVLSIGSHYMIPSIRIIRILNLHQLSKSLYFLIRLLQNRQSGHFLLSSNRIYLISERSTQICFLCSLLSGIRQSCFFVTTQVNTGSSRSIQFKQASFIIYKFCGRKNQEIHITLFQWRSLFTSQCRFSSLLLEVEKPKSVPTLKRPNE